MRPEFEAFPKIPRLRRTIVVTEKIDGTNAQVVVTAEGEVYAGSRNRYVEVGNDNYGFAAWVKANEEALRDKLGCGTHYGEWWGPGIQRGYGLKDKRFSLFNTARWNDVALPDGVGVVPILYAGQYSDHHIAESLEQLRSNGSVASPGFMRPEGVVVYMQASGTLHKVLLEGDDLPKGFLVRAERQEVARQQQS